MIWIAKHTIRIVLLYTFFVIGVNVLRTPLPGLPQPVAQTIAHVVDSSYTFAREAVAEAVASASPEAYEIGGAILHKIETSRPVVELTIALREALERSLTERSARTA